MSKAGRWETETIRMLKEAKLPYPQQVRVRQAKLPNDIGGFWFMYRGVASLTVAKDTGIDEKLAFSRCVIQVMSEERVSDRGFTIEDRIAQPPGRTRRFLIRMSARFSLRIKHKISRNRWGRSEMAVLIF